MPVGSIPVGSTSLRAVPVESRPVPVARPELRPDLRLGSARSSRPLLKRARVLLAYKHTLLRQALRALLLSDGEVEVIAEAEDGKEALEKAERLRPDVVLMDVALPILNGIEATRLIRRRVPRTKILLLTLAASDDDLFQILQAGAAGFLPKEADAEELARAIHSVHHGGSYLSPTLAERAGSLRRAEGGEPRAASAPEPLSLREREVLQLIADGLGNQEIANRLCVSVKTVEAHKSHIMRKLNLRGRTDLIKYAIRKGMIDLGDQMATWT